MKKKILIVGGGFGGVKVALELSRLSDTYEITLVSNTSHFEYHAYLYRVVAGRTPLEVCLPLREIFNGKDVNIVQDTIISLDSNNKVVFGLFGSKYSYDELVLALGSVPEFYNIDGLDKFAFTFKTINDALKLKKHIHEMFEKCSMQKGPLGFKECLVHLVIVGGGASGVELAGELALYTKKLSRKHKVSQSMVRIDLVEASDRILPALGTHLSYIASQRLKTLGVSVLTSKKVESAANNKLILKDGEIPTNTIIWTAGVKTAPFYSESGLFQTNSKGQVCVDDNLHALKQNDIYVIGDAAEGKFSGLGQTALKQATFVANSIANNSQGFIPSPPITAIPIGAGWALFKWKKIVIAGRLGWYLRRIFDLKFYLELLPFSKAFRAFRQDSVLCEDCVTCTNSL